MKLYEKIDKDTQGKNRIFNFYSACRSCGVAYKKQKLKAEGKQQEFYCSTVCYNNAEHKVTLTCSHCEKEFTRTKSQINKRVKNQHINFCSRECKDAAVHYMEEIRPEHYGTSDNYRIKAFKNYPKACNRCGFDNEQALEVHHRDRDRLNNDLSNLEILCANCHTIEHKINGY
jgi:hypothetical protein